MFSRLVSALALVSVCAGASAQIDARMLRQPDVSDSRIVFVYAGDIWVVDKNGGIANRLSSPEGEESWPKFSPDGQTIAFTGNYDGNEDIYTIPTLGGVPTRITHHPASDRMVDWHPNGELILYATGMTSGKGRFNQLYTVARDGGLPEKLPMAYGEFASYSPDGSKIAYMPWDQEFRTWKRYRGGLAPDIWLFQLEDFESANMTDSPALDSLPMWQGERIYFLSDRGENQRGNLWAFDTTDQRMTQVTFFEEFDVRHPSLGPSEIVFENGGSLYLYDFAAGQHRAVDIDVVTDRSTLKPRATNIGKFIEFTDDPAGG